MTACVVCGSTQHEHVYEKDGYELVRCSKCDLVAVANPPTTEELSRLYDSEHGYHTDWLDPDSDAAARERAAAAEQASVISEQPFRGRLCDVGCSVGFFLDEARARGWEVTGVEMNPTTADTARETFGLDVHTGTTATVDLEPGSFDVVTLWDVIEHVPDPPETLAEVRELLRPGGTLWLETPNIDGLFPRVSYGLGRRLGHWPHPEPPFHLFQFSVDTLTRVLNDAGFDVTDVRHVRIPLRYTFGGPRDMARTPQKAGYAAVFGAFAAVGPLVNRGDSILVAARRRSG